MAFIQQAFARSLARPNFSSPGTAQRDEVLCTYIMYLCNVVELASYLSFFLLLLHFPFFIFFPCVVFPHWR